MISLVIKDLKLSIKMMIFAIFYALFISFISISHSDDSAVNVLYIMSVIAIVMILVIYTNGYDEKNKSGIILNSFPIKKRDIVKGKYFTLIVYIIVSCTFMLLFTHILKAIGFGNGAKIVSISELILPVNVCLIFYSVYYPFYFKIGEGMRTFNAILWAMVFIAPSMITKIGKKLEANGMLEKLLSIDLYKMNLIFFIAAFLIFYISLQVSKKLYNTREF